MRKVSDENARQHTWYSKQSKFLFPSQVIKDICKFLNFHAHHSKIPEQFACWIWFAFVLRYLVNAVRKREDPFSLQLLVQLLVGSL